MSKAKIIHELHDDFAVTLSEAEKAYDIAVEYIRLRSAVGDHPEDYEPSEYILVKASSQSEIIHCKYCRYREFDEHYGYICGLDTGDPYELGRCADDENWFCADAERRDD